MNFQTPKTLNFLLTPTHQLTACSMKYCRKNIVKDLGSLRLKNWSAIKKTFFACFKREDLTAIVNVYNGQTH